MYDFEPFIVIAPIVDGRITRKEWLFKNIIFKSCIRFIWNFILLQWELYQNYLDFTNIYKIIIPSNMDYSNQLEDLLNENDDLIETDLKHLEAILNEPDEQIKIPNLHRKSVSIDLRISIEP